MINRYGDLFHIDDFNTYGNANRLERVRLTGTKAGGGYDEKWLQRLVAANPRALPIEEIEAYLADAKPVCMELSTKAGPIDLVLISPRGDIVIVECKLWRNPQARREVVGQIIDYAKELPQLTYEAFEASICKADPAGGAAKSDTLYARSGGEITEAAFIDAVTRNLRRGRFLLLIVGDGIQEGVESIADFLQQHAGMHFTLALVEIAIFKFSDAGYLVQPRVLARTQMVSRGIVQIEDDRVGIRANESMSPSARSSDVMRRSQEVPKVPKTISEARLYEDLDSRSPGSAVLLRQFLETLEGLGVRPRYTKSMIILEAVAGDRDITLGNIEANAARIWLDSALQQAASFGCADAAKSYYLTLAAMITDGKLRAEKLDPKGKTGTTGLPLEPILARPLEWANAAGAYLQTLQKAGRNSMTTL